jgi:hypothetical protein
MTDMRLDAPAATAAPADDVVARFTRLTPRSVRSAAAVLTGVFFVLRAWVAGCGYLTGDDYLIIGHATAYPLFSREVLEYSHNVHVMPASMLLGGIAGRISPYQYWFPLLTLLVFQALYFWLAWRLVERVFGWRPLALVPLGILVAAPVTLLPWVWWAAAVNMFPLLMATMAGALCALNVVEGRHRVRWTAAAVLIVFVAMLFFVKAILLPLALLAAVWIVVPAPSPWWSRLLHVLRRGASLWVLLAAVSGGYLAWYRTVVVPGSAPAFDLPLLMDVMSASVVRTFVPASVGGPVAWTALPASVASTGAPDWVVVGALQVVAIFAIIGCWWSGRARVAWAMVLGQLLLDGLMLAVVRPFWAEVGAYTLRYNADAVVLFALAVGVSLMPVRGEQTPPRMERARRSLLRRRRWVLLTASATAAVALGLCAVSTLALAGPVQDDNSRSWALTLRESVIERGSTDILSGDNPFGYFMPGYGLSPLSPWLHQVEQVDQLVTIGQSGAVVPGVVLGPSVALPARDACTYSHGTGVVHVVLPTPVFPWQHTVRLEYLASGAMTTGVRIGAGESVQVPLAPGGHVTYVHASGGGTDLTIGPTSTGEGMCVGRVDVGDVVPDPTAPAVPVPGLAPEPPPTTASTTAPAPTTSAGAAAPSAAPAPSASPSATSFPLPTAVSSPATVSAPVPGASASG